MMGSCCFWKRFKKGNSDAKKAISSYFYPSDFQVVWNRIHCREAYSVFDSDAEWKNYLRYVIDVVKLDIQGSLQARMFYQDTQTCPLIFPAFATRPAEMGKEVSFEGNTVICMPYDFKKMAGAVVDINRDGFLKDVEHTGFYFPELKLLIIQSGQHHSSVASIKGNCGGAANADVYHLADIYPRLSVSDDYRFWLSKGEEGEDELPIEVIDPRFALLYNLAKELKL